MPDSMTTFVNEVIDETIGTSSKKWALILISLLAGAAIALWVARRAHDGEPDATPSSDSGTS